MVVHNFNVMGVLALPAEANPPAVVDADAVLAFAVGFQVIAGRHAQIQQRTRGVNLRQLSQGHALDVRRQAVAALAPPEAFRLLAAEAGNHDVTLSHGDNGVKRRCHATEAKTMFGSKLMRCACFEAGDVFATTLPKSSNRLFESAACARPALYDTHSGVNLLPELRLAPCLVWHWLSSGNSVALSIGHLKTCKNTNEIKVAGMAKWQTHRT